MGIAIGNGLSRENFDLETIRSGGITAGCNNLFLDFEPDYLITLDSLVNRRIKWMTDRNVKRSFQWVSRHVTDNGIRLLTVDGVPVADLDQVNDGFNNQSELLAAAFLTEILLVKELYMIGVDFFLPVPGRQNDIYNGNEPYSDGLVYCWNLLSERNPDCLFYRVGSIADRDRDFFKTRLKGFTFIENFRDLPI